MTIGERIKERRKELNLTQTELAQRLGYKSKVAVSNVENDKEDLTTTRVKKYAEALECTPEYLMGWSYGTFGSPKRVEDIVALSEIMKEAANNSREIGQIHEFEKTLDELCEQLEKEKRNLEKSISDESKIMKAYRTADEMTKEMIKRVLKLE